MPNTLSITISNNTPHPNGNSATLSKTGANGNAYQATWTASDDEYELVLPAAVWNAPPGGSLSFTLAQGQTSGVYSLKPSAPTGLQGYAILTPAADPPPKVLIEP
jgi:hypothetical protein